VTQIFSEERVPRAQKELEKKQKLGIHPIYNCTKFNMIALFLKFSRLPRSFY